MSNDEIELLAKEAGFVFIYDIGGQLCTGDEKWSLTKFAQLVASAERERCAKVAEQEALAPFTDPFCCRPQARDIAEQIRALK